MAGQWPMLTWFRLDTLADGDDHKIGPTRVRREDVAGCGSPLLSFWPDGVLGRARGGSLCGLSLLCMSGTREGCS